jgi:hypothetical protein
VYGKAFESPEGDGSLCFGDEEGGTDDVCSFGSAGVFEEGSPCYVYKLVGRVWVWCAWGKRRGFRELVYVLVGQHVVIPGVGSASPSDQLGRQSLESGAPRRGPGALPQQPQSWLGLLRRCSFLVFVRQGGFIQVP